jgi:hypothetical protein
MPRERMTHVVVFLPGITGSVLKKDGHVVWGYGAGTIAKSLFTGGGSIAKALALPQDDPEVEDLGDGIVADELMPDLHLLPGIWKIDGYTGIIEAIKSAFEVTEGKNLFSFPYDWRRDNRAAARKLARVSHEWLTNWRRSSNNPNARLILVAHSMGGLVSRYFLECLEGWKVTEALVTFGTPFRGSLNAVDGLANGLKKGPLDLSDLVRQLTGLYQLLPIYECYDGGDGKLVRVGETPGVPNIDATKAAASLAFYREMEHAVASNQNIAQYKSASYRVFPCVGISQLTNLSARRAGGKVELLTTYKGEDFGGDGTVPRVSAIPLELSQNPAAMYAATQPGSLQNAAAIIANLTGVLAGLSLNLGDFRDGSKAARAAPGKTEVALEVEDIFLADEPIVIRARPTVDTPLTVTVWRDRQDEPIATEVMLRSATEWQTVELAPPAAAGVYRVRISGANVEGAEDSFVVAPVTEKTL